MEMVHALAIAFAVCVILLVAMAAGEIAQRKARPFWLYFVAGLIAGPLALVGALVLPRRRRRA
jgi:Kef-type K+ transport system membrane component KefB